MVEQAHACNRKAPQSISSISRHPDFKTEGKGSRTVRRQDGSKESCRVSAVGNTAVSVSSMVQLAACQVRCRSTAELVLEFVNNGMDVSSQFCQMTLDKVKSVNGPTRVDGRSRLRLAWQAPRPVPNKPVNMS
ncbi:unnamed protein product [Durusdinium trenchii]|uniref:Uncharacterized protein n=1 Tax=Durusdinium trenchii TaxID=1381693 RepID=A0ABP0Q4B8_9DINO